MSSSTGLPAYSMNREDFPHMYERRLVTPLFRPWAEDLLDRVALPPGARVLDVACGTGIVARLARQRLGDGGVVVGVDVSGGMLAVARAAEPRVEWREGDASALPAAPGEQFDVITCQQGLQFFRNREAAAREMRRVLAAGGTALLSTWRSLDEMPLLRNLKAVAERHVGSIVDQRHALGDAAALERLLVDAGFEQVEVETRSLPMRFENGSDFVRLNAMALVGMSAAALDQAARERLVKRLVDESADVVVPYSTGGVLTCALTANIAVAR